MASIFLDIDLAISMFGAIEVVIVDVEGKLGVVVPGPYLWPGPCRFVGSEVQETDLIPHETSNMDLYR
jgi:hypothetical protein